MILQVYGGRGFGTLYWPDGRKKLGPMLLAAQAEIQTFERVMVCIDAHPEIFDPGKGLVTTIEEEVDGVAPGADSLGGEWAVRNGRKRTPFEADWPRFGESAGPIRNGWMLDYLRAKRDEPGKPTVAALECPGGKGTAHMRSLLEKHGFHIYTLSAVAGCECHKVG